MNIKDDYILDSLLKLEDYIKTQNYSGFDPYDALNSNVLNNFKNKYLKLAATQFFVYSPRNFRNFFQIEPGRNPKALGIFLQAYCKMFKSNIIEENYFKKVYTKLTNFLLKNYSQGYSGYCWGFNFNWQDFTRYSKKNMPTVVVTSYIANSFLDLFEITENKKYLNVAISSCEFILKDLNVIENNKGICFSYTPIDNFSIHNANLIGAALLARVHSITNQNMLLEYAKQAFDFSLNCQKDDGSWAYSIDPVTGRERNQIDFHQGFILDSIINFMKYSNPKDDKYKKSLLKGADFYMNKQFNKEGHSKWRLPMKCPVDIHHQAQGIITFSRLYGILKENKYLHFARKISLWTIENMQDKSGYFYYQKWPLITNKIPYMRWGQAWMMSALSQVLMIQNKNNE
jgi:hypothetical protein